MLRLASAALSSCLAAVALPAQVTPVPGTGCSSAITHVGGQPLRGQAIWITHPFPCAFRGPAVLAIGTAASIPVPGCSAATCVIGVQPVELTIGGISISRFLLIPPVASLVGACFVAQTGCLPVAGCFQPDQAQQICIQ